MEKIYFITDDSCEPLDPGSLSIESMNKSLFRERYGSLDWAFDSYENAVEYVQNSIE